MLIRLGFAVAHLLELGRVAIGTDDAFSFFAAVLDQVLKG